MIVIVTIKQLIIIILILITVILHYTCSTYTSTGEPETTAIDSKNS